jgi:hypothetical protein
MHGDTRLGYAVLECWCIEVRKLLFDTEINKTIFETTSQDTESTPVCFLLHDRNSMGGGKGKNNIQKKTNTIK